MALYHQGFKDTSLTIWQASCVLRNYELRTGKTISHEDLDSGTLADEFTDEDYQLDESVSSYPCFTGVRLIYTICQFSNVFPCFLKSWINFPFQLGG